MHDGRFSALLAELFEAHGFEVSREAALEGRSGTVYTVPVLAERDGKAYVVEPVPAGRTVDADAVHDLAEVTKDIAGDLGVLCFLEEAAPDAALGAEGIVTLWDRATVAGLVGEACLVDVGLEPGPLPLTAVAPVDAAVEGPADAAPTELRLPEAFTASPDAGLDADLRDEGSELAPEADHASDETTDDAADEPEDAPEDELAVEPSVTRDPVPARPDAPGRMEIAEDEHDAIETVRSVPLYNASHDTVELPRRARPSTPPKLHVHEDAQPVPKWTWPLLPASVGLDEAIARAQEHVYRAARVEMIVRPVYVFDYECDVLKEGSLDHEVVVGRIEVDGTRPQAREVPQDHTEGQALDLSPRTGLTFEERALRIKQENAERLAQAVMAKRHAREIDVAVEDEASSFSYTEKRKVQPTPDAMRLECVGVYGRPVWRVVGPGTQVDIDAVTGAAVGGNARRADVIIVD